MAIVEFQVQESKFLELVRTEFDRQRLPGPTLPMPGLQGKLLQRFRCDGLSVQTSAPIGHIGLATKLVVEYNNNLAEVRAAGSMQRPQTNDFVMRPPLTVGVVVPDASTPDQAPMLRVSSPYLPLSFDVPMAIPEQFQVQSAAIAAGDRAVAVRLGTQSGDPVLSPVLSRVEESEWTQLISGAVFAETLTGVLEETLADMLSDQLLQDRPARGQWVGSSRPYAVASATVRAVTPLIDALIDFQVVMIPEVVGRTLQLTVTLSWHPRTGIEYLVEFFAPIIGRLVLEEVLNDQVVKRLPGRLSHDRFEEIGRDDESITLRGTQPLEPPAEYFVLDGAEVTAEGLVCAGSVRLRHPRRGLEAWMSRATYSLDANCGARRVDVNFYTPRVWLRDLGVAGNTAPSLFYSHLVFEPQNAWVVEPLAHASWFEAAFTFLDPPGGRLPAGTPTSVYLHTDCGLLWVDLGAVPLRPPEPGTADVAEMLSTCLAISDRWGMGPLNVGWLVDPPDVLNPDDLVRNWTIRFAGIPEDALVEIVATDRQSGTERVVSVVSGHRDALVQVMTAPNEVIELRAPRPFEAPMPVVEQRWIEPITAIPVSVESQVIDHVDGFLGVREPAGRTVVIDLATESELASSALQTDRFGRGRLGRLQGALDRQFERAAGIEAALVTEMSPDTVAIARGPEVVLAKVHGYGRL